MPEIHLLTTRKEYLELRKKPDEKLSHIYYAERPDDAKLEFLHGKTKEEILAVNIDYKFWKTFEFSAEAKDFKLMELMLDPDIVAHIQKSDMAGYIGLSGAFMNYPFLDDSEESLRCKELAIRWNRAYPASDDQRVNLLQSRVQHHTDLHMHDIQAAVGICGQLLDPATHDSESLKANASRLTQIIIGVKDDNSFKRNVINDYLDAYYPDHPPAVSRLEYVEAEFDQNSEDGPAESAKVVHDVDYVFETIFFDDSKYCDFYYTCLNKYSQSDSFINYLNEKIIENLKSRDDFDVQSRFLVFTIKSGLLNSEAIEALSERKFHRSFTNGYYDFIEVIQNSSQIFGVFETIKNIHLAGFDVTAPIMVHRDGVDEKRCLLEAAIHTGDVQAFIFLLVQGADPSALMHVKATPTSASEELSACQVLDIYLQNDLHKHHSSFLQMADVLKAQYAKDAVNNVLAEFEMNFHSHIKPK